VSEKKTQGIDPQMIGLMAVGLVFLAWSLWRKTEVARYLFWKMHGGQIIAIGILIAGLALIFAGTAIYNWYIQRCFDQAITDKDDTAVFLGKDETGKATYLKEVFRTTHTLVTGTTSAGKTQSVVLPWAIHDIEQGNGLLIIDGKADNSFLEKLYAHVVKNKRVADFRFFSLANLEKSATFNPLAEGSPQEVAERVFAAFPFENEYYRNVQYKIFWGLLRLIHEKDRVPTFALVERLLNDHELLKLWLQDCEDKALKRQLTKFNEEKESDRAEKISGLDSALNKFSSGETAILYNSLKPHIQMDEVLRDNLICYFQLPTMYYPYQAQATGTLVLQALQAAVSKRHLGLSKNPRFFSCYLDDFQDYMYEKFAGLLNKSRSANVGVLFSHQSLGDLDKVSPAFRNIVLTCSNVKIVMRTVEPETCDYFARGFGTVKTEKVTERRSHDGLSEHRTGEKSVREVDEFRVHPNTIKDLEVGQGIVSIPHPKGIKTLKLKFSMREDLPPCELPDIAKEMPKEEKDPVPAKPEPPVDSKVT
jgi:type IV secretory pathway TraG/TraD family ATPase VirD4